MEKLLRTVKGNDYVIVMENFNEIVGKEEQKKEIGRYGLGKRYERGDLLAQFCQNNKLIVTNTWFKNPKKRI